MNGILYKYNNNNFSKYIYLLPSKYFIKYDNKVPIDVLKKYYNKYHILSSGLTCLDSKLRIKKSQNKKVIFFSESILLKVCLGFSFFVFVFVVVLGRLLILLLFFMVLLLILELFFELLIFVSALFCLKISWFKIFFFLCF